MGLCYANPPISQLAKVLTKSALEGARVVLCTPERMLLLDLLTVDRTKLPTSPIYVPADSEKTMPVLNWAVPCQSLMAL